MRTFLTRPQNVVLRKALFQIHLWTGLILGLYVTGNYSHGDDRRDPRRLFAGCALGVALPLWIPLWNQGPGIVLLQYVLTSVLVWCGIVAERLEGMTA